MNDDERCPECGSDRVAHRLRDDGDYDEFICFDCKSDWLL